VGETWAEYSVFDVLDYMTVDGEARGELNI
jgi:hypothetical protein